MNTAEPGRPLLLWGMMGAGKSAVAREIQSRTTLNVVDLDAVIEHEQGLTPHQLITDLGIECFRALEESSLRALLKRGEVDVIALGGGALLDAQFRREVRTQSVVCSLFAEPSVLVDRLRTTYLQRPLLSGNVEGLEERLTNHIDRRREAYLDVDFVVDTSELSLSEIASTLLRMHDVCEAA